MATCKVVFNCLQHAKWVTQSETRAPQEMQLGNSIQSFTASERTFWNRVFAAHSSRKGWWLGRLCRFKVIRRGLPELMGQTIVALCRCKDPGFHFENDSFRPFHRLEASSSFAAGRELELAAMGVRRERACDRESWPSSVSGLTICKPELSPIA